MKPLALLVTLAPVLLGCAGASPIVADASDYERAEAAVPPFDQDSAEAAVRQFFETSLKDPESARYTFQDLTNGVVVFSDGSKYHGYFMCGTINARNSYGGYTGSQPFFAHFDENDPSIASGTVDDDRYNIIGGWCAQAYGSQTS